MVPRRPLRLPAPIRPGRAARPPPLPTALGAASRGYGWLPSQLRLLQWNACSLAAHKVAALLGSVAAVFPDVIAVSETMDPSEDVLDHMRRNHYDVYRCERPRVQGCRTSGGVALMSRRERFAADPVVLATAPTLFEYVALPLTARHGDSPSFVAVSIYVPPDTVATADKRATLQSELRMLYRELNPAVVAGDWNARHAEWDPCDSLSGSTYLRGKLLSDLFEELAVTVAAPAEATYPSSGSVLDFAVYGAEFQQSERCDVLKGHTVSDHEMVHTVLHMHPLPLTSGEAAPPVRYPVRGVRWNKVTPADELAFSISLETDLSRAPDRGVDNCARFLEDSILRAMDCLPRRKPVPRHTLPSHLHALRVNAESAWMRVGVNPNDGTVATARAATSAFRDACQSFAANLCMMSTDAAAIEDTAAWRIFSALDSPPAPCCVIRHNDEEWATDAAKAEGFLRFFSAKCQRRGDKSTAWEAPANFDPPPPVQLEEVKASIAESDVSKAPDGRAIEVRTLRLLTPAALKYVARLFDEILCRGRLPRLWKVATVVPLRKPKGDAGQASGYRPVAITSLLCRILERVVLRRIFAGGLKLSPEQFGFRPGSSTVEPLCLASLAIQDGFRREYAYAKQQRQFKSVLLALDFTDFASSPATSSDNICGCKGMRATHRFFTTSCRTGRNACASALSSLARPHWIWEPRRGRCWDLCAGR